MCDKALNSWLFILKFIPDWFVTNKILETLDNSIYYTLMKLNLMMIVLLKKILKLVFILDLWLGVEDSNSRENVKKTLATS